MEPEEEPEEEEKVEEEKEVPPKREDFTNKIRKNPWVLSTLVLGVVTLILLVSNSSGGMTGNVISEGDIKEEFLDYLQEQGADVEDMEITKIFSKSGLYGISFDYEGEPYPVSYYITQDGKFIGMMDEINKEGNIKPAEPILECAEPYGITSDTIIFYYSNSCSFCTMMKPGVEVLEKEGYKFKWIEGSDAEASELIDNCVRSHMTRTGVPQFICPKTDEIHVGAFTDENRELDQLALKEWVDNCISD